MADPARLLTYARAMRRAPTLAERQLWKRLRDRRLAGLKFRRQVPISDDIADFACFQPKMVVEADGGSHATSQDYDAARDFWFREQGFVVLRFSNSDAIFEGEAVVERIRKAAGLG